jgi:hypothetical protein
MPSRGQRCRASGLGPHHPKDLLQCPDAGTEGVTIAVDDLRQLPGQRFGLFVCQFKVHAPNIGAADPEPLGSSYGDVPLTGAISRNFLPHQAATPVDGTGTGEAFPDAYSTAMQFVLIKHCREVWPQLVFGGHNFEKCCKWLARITRDWNHNSEVACSNYAEARLLKTKGEWLSPYWRSRRCHCITAKEHVALERQSRMVFAWSNTGFRGFPDVVE